MHTLNLENYHIICSKKIQKCKNILFCIKKHKIIKLIYYQGIFL